MRQIQMAMLAVLFLIFAGCTSTTQDAGENNLSSRNIPTYQILKTGVYPHDDGRYLDAPKAFLVYYSDNAEDVASFGKEYRLLTGEEAPAFDGSVVIAKMGTKSTGGYSYALHEIKEHESYIEVQIENRQPAADSIVTQALTNPYIIVLLPENHKEVKVTEVR